MTRVTLLRSGPTYTVRCQGHATGSVEACAAVSCLVYTLAGWLHNMATLTLHEKLESADAEIIFAGGKEAETVFDMICVGFLQLEKEYSAFVSVDFRDI